MAGGELKGSGPFSEVAEKGIGRAGLQIHHAATTIVGCCREENDITHLNVARCLEHFLDLEGKESIVIAIFVRGRQLDFFAIQDATSQDPGQSSWDFHIESG